MTRRCCCCYCCERMSRRTSFPRRADTVECARIGLDREHRAPGEGCCVVGGAACCVAGTADLFASSEVTASAVKFVSNVQAADHSRTRTVRARRSRSGERARKGTVPHNNLGAANGAPNHQFGCRHPRRHCAASRRPVLVPRFRMDDRTVSPRCARNVGRTRSADEGNEIGGCHKDQSLSLVDDLLKLPIPLPTRTSNEFALQSRSDIAPLCMRSALVHRCKLVLTQHDG